MTAPQIAVLVSACAASFSALTALISVLTARKVAAMQRSLNQRQLLLPLWQYLTKLNDIDPQNPVTPQIIETVNTLELVALCCEGGMVDKTIIKRTFRDGFMRHYQAINACVSVPKTNKTGSQLLAENKAAMAFYNELIAEHLDADRPKKLGE